MKRISLFFLSLLIVLSLAASDSAASIRIKKNQSEKTTIKELRKAAKKCSRAKSPRFNFTASPAGLNAWPRQYIQLRWNLRTSDDDRWTHPVLFRTDRDMGERGESVPALWVKRLKASDLTKGLNTFYLTTECGVASVEVGLVPQPEISSAPEELFKGEEIVIKGKNFRKDSDSRLRRLLIAEPGTERRLEIVDWSDDSIRALVTDEVGYGRHSLFVETGKDETHSRRSESVPVLISRQESLPPLMLASALQKVFSTTAIHLNNYVRGAGGRRLIARSSYVTLPETMGKAKEYMKVPVFSFNIKASAPYSKRIVYYVNDLNLDTVTVTSRGDGFVMAFFFENLHSEFLGRAASEGTTAPPDIELDNLRVKVEMEPVALSGLISFDYKKIEVTGNFRGSGGYCDYGDADICAKLFKRYEKTIINGLGEKVRSMITREESLHAVGRALEPWLRANGVGEVTRVKLSTGKLLIDHIPK